MSSSSFHNGYTVQAGELSWDSHHRIAGEKVLEWQFKLSAVNAGRVVLLAQEAVEQV